MKKITLHVSGNVQRVGYRAKVKSIAKALGIKGSIQNLPDGSKDHCTGGANRTG
jgi:acylphosphatase